MRCTSPRDPNFSICSYNISYTNHPDGTAHGGTAIQIKFTIAYYELLKYTEAEIQATSIKIRGPLITWRQVQQSIFYVEDCSFPATVCQLDGSGPATVSIRLQWSYHFPLSGSCPATVFHKMAVVLPLCWF